MDLKIVDKIKNSSMGRELSPHMTYLKLESANSNILQCPRNRVVGTSCRTLRSLFPDDSVSGTEGVDWKGRELIFCYTCLRSPKKC
jgi:hypothetical protein